MSTSSHNGRSRMPGQASVEQTGEVSRRAVLAGTVATTAVAAVLPIAGAAYAEGADPKQDMMPFLLLSAALTGVHVSNLAPEFSPDPKEPADLLKADAGVDPINIKNEYFAWINAADGATFGKLLQIAREHSHSVPDIIAAVNGGDDTKFLARSIALLWYLGSWYKPADLKSNSTPGAAAFIPSEVVSAKAYTQGLVWQIAQAHPMGYSNLQFGYWSREPVDLNDPGARSNLGFITPTIP
jgi:hypothetical protein